MATLSILHLSDLHISEKNVSDQRVVLEKLFLDLSNLLATGQQYDMIVFSGDLIAKGDYSEANVKLVEDIFVKPLLDAVKISSERLFFAPGNHDLQLSKIHSTLKPSFDALTTVQQTNEFIENITNAPYFTAGFDSYNELINRVSTANPVFANNFFRAYIINVAGMMIGICCINSAWKATGSANDADYGRLQIGQRQIDLLLGAIKGCAIKFAILHHPLSWLTPTDQSVVQQMIYREFDAVFYGHNHAANSSHIAGPYFSTFVSNAGCLYQSRDWFNGYSIVTYKPDESMWSVKVREYYSQRNTFDVSTRFSEHGEANFNVALDRTKVQVLKFPTVDYKSAVQETVNEQLLTTAISDVAPKNLGALFVPPPLSHLSEKQLNEDNNEDGIKYLELTDLLSSNKPIFFVGQKEFGKTTLLHYICSECNDIVGAREPSFGCYINLEAVKPTKASILEAIVNFTHGTYRRSEFIDLLKVGRMTICFDNLPVHDDRLLSVLSDFIKENNLNRYYFSVNESFQSSISQRVIPRLGLDATVVYIHSFGRRQTRNLISKWFGDTSEALRERVDGMLASLRRLNIPRTPFLISILLWVQERKISFNPVNQAEILDIFVDGILDKLKESKLLSEYDSTVKRHFLTELSCLIHQLGRLKLSHNELDKFAADYFDKKGLPSSSGPFLEELKRKGILIDLGDDVCFKFDCLRAFFLSVKIKESQELFQYSMTPEGFLKLGRELDYFTGKNRNNIDAITGALLVVEHYYKLADINHDLKLNIFSQISLNESPITAERKESLEKALLGDRPTIEKQEELLDELDVPAHRVVIGQDHNEAVSRDAKSVSDFTLALQTASAILRNSELIDDAELKAMAYDKLVEYWSHLLLVLLVTIEKFSDDEEAAAIEEIIPQLPKDLSIYLMKLLTPSAIFAMAFESLGTTKLENMILRNIKESPETVCRLLSTVLYVDLELQDRLTMLKKLAEISGASRFLTELVFFKFLHLYMFRKLTSKEESQIKSMLGDIFAQLSSSKGKSTASVAKTRLIDQLDRKKLRSEFIKKTK